MSSNDSSHSLVSSGSMSGSWVGSPSLMMEKRWRPEATGDSSHFLFRLSASNPRTCGRETHLYWSVAGSRGQVHLIDATFPPDDLALAGSGRRSYGRRRSIFR